MVGSSEIKDKECANCPKTFKQFNSMQRCCSPQCEREHKANKKKKKEAKSLSQLNLISARNVKPTKPRTELVKKAEKVINTYIKLRDYFDGCISCGEWSENPYFFEAGHYRTVGSAPHLRFNLHNINKQCTDCNQRLSGNKEHYEEGLIAKIGLTKFHALETNNKGKKYTVEYCERLIEVFRKKTNRLRARRRKQIAC